jgi:two-component system, cell cycle sensor histidine kinase and response regulator CckA
MSTRVLLVEDNPSDAELVEISVRRAVPDLELRQVDNEESFVRSLREFKPDLVISDHNLPAFSGARALELSLADDPSRPFLLVTGSLDEETAVRYMKSGATDYLLKDRTARLGPAVLAALKQSRQRSDLDLQQLLLQKVIDTDPSLIFVKDFDGRFVLVNRAVAEVYGGSVEDLLGKTDGDFNTNAEEVEHFLEDDRQVMERNEPKYIPEEPVTNPTTGVTRWFQTIKVPLNLPGHDRKMMLGVATDITPRRQLEEQLRQSQKMEAVGRLAGGIAHDFNNVLTAILGYSQILLSDLDSGDPRREDVQEIEHAAERAATLTRQLLAFSRRQVLQPKVLNLNDVVGNLDKFLRRLIGEDIDLRIRLSPQLWPVYADSGQMEQVLMNLAVNSRDAMPTGGKLTIETANVDLDEAYAQQHLTTIPGQYVMLAVSDTGAGMSKETMARVFEPFFTTKGAGQGTGLGLSTVYGIVKQSDGNIWVYSEPGQGSTFKIYLPHTTDAGESIRPARQDEADVRGSETILLVEDEGAVRTLAAKVLRGLGYHVLEARLGREAMEIGQAFQGPIELLLTDVIMPESSGSELARQMVTIRPAIRVLFMSGYTDEAIIHHGVLVANMSYLQKPFTPDILARKVREVLDTSAGHSQGTVPE